MGVFSPGVSGGDFFRRALTATVVSLIAVCAVLVALSFVQGPKLQSAIVDPERVVTAPSQQLRLFANQALSEVDPEQVEIFPAAPFTVSVENDIIQIQFTGLLSFDTDYTVAVTGVTSRYQDREAEFRHEFTTATGAFTYLDRADPAQPGQRDRIVSIGVSGDTRESIFEAERIQDFAMFPGAVAVVTVDEDGAGSLSVVSLADGAVKSLGVPRNVTIDAIGSGPDSGILAFTVTSLDRDASEYTGTLFTVDLEGPPDAAPVPDLDGAPLEVLDWSFFPTGGAAVARTVDDTILQLDLAGGAPATPLGSYTDLISVAPDGTEIVVADIYGAIALSLATGDERRLPTPPIDGIPTFGGEIELLGDAQGLLQQVAILDEETGRFASFVVFTDGEIVRILYESPDGQGSIEGFTVSPNGQYVAITVIPNVSTSVPDGYAVDPRSTSISSVVVDIATGAIVRSVDGFGVEW